ncbi:hypothetical protein BDN72DRAFT_873096 [Pluteus cervinus]|uniref:Uncharacterized protein n=1 Tax=Pluteus cervinus TaxID=181527 RepID=A0ACD3A064_9AGAR|nr:hypothetical protein BDN72DRAFT_873096 [Pluteus cervinus]
MPSIPTPVRAKRTFLSTRMGKIFALPNNEHGTAFLGFLGCTPDKPQLAFAFAVFELYRQLHRVCPRLSIQGFMKSLDHLHHVPVNPSLPEQFSAAYDCYLEMMRDVDLRVNDAMDYTTKSWLAEHVCPPCLYKTDAELPMKFSLLAAMDGNVSLKLFDSQLRSGRPREDNRDLESGRWLDPDFVNQFKDEVAKGKKKTDASRPTVDTSTPSAPSTQGKGKNKAPIPGTDGGETSINTCVERWRNAGPEARKKMFAVFAISGIFLTVCRHGHALTLCDMIRSGELMKYPIAHVRALIDRYGASIGLGYDIFCQLMKTLRKSSLAGDVVSNALDGVVPAFHGYAHNRLCQLSWHPLYKDGTGIEDFEECERTFSKSNELAAVTRLATPFHRRQQIEEHFNFHDLDKFAASGTFIYQNYVQALERIRVDGAALRSLEADFADQPDYEQMLKDEKSYLESLKKEDPQRAQDFEQESDASKKEYGKRDYYTIHMGYTQKEISLINARYLSTYKKWLAHGELLSVFEISHEITIRWVPQSVEWQRTEKLYRERAYLKALDNLERLYIQRMLEMTKLGMSGIGYKLRDHLGKALKTRVEAIRNALNAYNKAAKLLVPPREELTWTKLMDVGNLSEFDLLRDTRQEVSKLAWVNPSRRAAMNSFFRIKRATEEIIRLNVEIRRLITYMMDREADFNSTYKSVKSSDEPLAYEIQERWSHLTKVHTVIAKDLSRTSKLNGFTGSLIPALDPEVPAWARDYLGIIVESVGPVNPTNTTRSIIPTQTQLTTLESHLTLNPNFSNEDPANGPQEESTIQDEFIPREIDVDVNSVLEMLSSL